MPLAPGTRLGPHEIIAPLGAGGMGEVYRARDPRLGREVAIKVLPAGFEADPERITRFEREARLLASLNHPNIAVLYGIEHDDGALCLVLELIEGESLAERLTRGALPIEEAFDVAAQVAAALEAAHEAGVVHRDLKPGNVMLRHDGLAKVLDFGLARGPAGAAAPPGAARADLTQSPTMTSPATMPGVILGTAAYMSPEQAKGRPADKRADVWAWGCLLYELLTGRRAFPGEDVSDTLAAILRSEPDWGALPAGTPPRVRELLARCLRKDARERLRDAGDARLLLAEARAHSEPPAAAGAARDRRRWIVPLVTAAVAIAATAAALLALRPALPAGQLRRFRVPVEGLTTHFFEPLALTRDGSAIAYEARGRLWIRRLERLDAIEVPGSNEGRAPFWSWDQSTLCFSANRKLWAFTPGGDQSRELCDIPESGQIVGGAWGADSRIVLAIWRGGLYEVAAGGGRLRPLLAPDSTIVDYHGPTFLPDGRSVLLYVHDKQGNGAVAIVEGSPPRLRRVYDGLDGSAVSYSPTGHLLVTQEGGAFGGATWAVPFSVSSRKATGPPFRILDGAQLASDSRAGLLVAAEDPASPTGQLGWWRRAGGAEEPVGQPQQGLSSPSLSPDGSRVAYVVVENQNVDIWVQDLVRGTRTRLTSSPVWEGHPAWSPDGTHIYYASRGGVGTDRIVGVAGDGSGAPDTIAQGLEPAVSPDGRNLVYTVDRKGNGDLWTVALAGGSAPRPFLVTPADESDPSFSPDGRWIAYTSDESGRREVYIRRYPEGGSRLQVSVNGGEWPRWMRRGDGIFYVCADTLELVSVGPGERPALGMPHALFSASAGEFDLRHTNAAGFPLDAHPDGQRFIGVRQVGPPVTRSLLFVENWLAEFRRR